MAKTVVEKIQQWQRWHSVSGWVHAMAAPTSTDVLFSEALGRIQWLELVVVSSQKRLAVAEAALRGIAVRSENTGEYVASKDIRDDVEDYFESQRT